jgi:hypothetical protein
MGEFQLRLTLQVEDPILIFYQPDNAAGVIVIKRFGTAHEERRRRSCWIIWQKPSRASSAAARDKIPRVAVAKLNAWRYGARAANNSFIFHLTLAPTILAVLART